MTVLAKASSKLLLCCEVLGYGVGTGGSISDSNGNMCLNGFGLKHRADLEYKLFSLNSKLNTFSNYSKNLLTYIVGYVDR
jgi:hypothetical protein